VIPVLYGAGLGLMLVALIYLTDEGGFERLVEWFAGLEPLASDARERLVASLRMRGWQA
jgi:hypothetical protein